MENTPICTHSLGHSKLANYIRSPFSISPSTQTLNVQVIETNKLGDLSKVIACDGKSYIMTNVNDHPISPKGTLIPYTCDWEKWFD